MPITYDLVKNIKTDLIKCLTCGDANDVGIKILDLTSTSSLDTFITEYDGSFARTGEINVFDFEAVLQTGIPTDVAGFYGGRWASSAWFNTESDGTTPIESVIGLATGKDETNQFASGEYRTFSAWDTVTCNVTKNQVGITGDDNTASELEDDDIGGYENIKKIFTIDNDSSWQSVSILIEKDTDTTRYPGLYFDLTGGSGLNRYVIFNTQTGAYSNIASDGDFTVLNIGNWWFVTLALQNNTSGNTVANIRIYPSISSDGTTEVATATGSIIVDWAQCRNARRCPIHLVRGGETMALADLHFSNDNLISASKGSVYVEFEAIPDYSEFINDTVILSNGSCEIRAEHLTSGISFNDGTNNTVGYVETPAETIKAVIVWENTEVRITTASGTTTGTYAGNFGDSTIYVGRNSTGRAFPGYISEVNFYHDQALSDADAALLVV